jgi:hypothetical protein
LLYAHILRVLLLPLLLQLGALLQITLCVGLQERQAVVCATNIEAAAD